MMKEKEGSYYQRKNEIMKYGFSKKKESIQKILIEKSLENPRSATRTTVRKPH